MRKIIKCIFNVALILTMLMGLMVSAYAADSITIDEPLSQGTTVFTVTVTNGVKADGINIYINGTKVGASNISSSFALNKQTWTITLTQPLNSGDSVVAETDLSASSPLQSAPALAIVRTQLAFDVTTPLAAGDTKITGTGTPGDTIILDDSTGTQIATTKKITVASDGTWTATATAPLVEGQVTATVSAPDLSTTPYASLGTSTTVIIPRTQLAIDTTLLFAGDTKITGTGTPGDTIILVDSTGTQIATTKKNITIASDGTWTATVTVPLIEGQAITAKVTVPDLSTTTYASLGTSAQVLVPARTQLAIDTTTPLVEGETKITGTGTPGDTIILVDSTTGTQIATTKKNITIASDGTWTATVTNPLVAGQVIEAQVSTPDLSTTPYASLGTSTQVLVIARTQLAIDTTTPLFAGDTKITGTGTPGDVIQLFDSTNTQIAAKKITIASDGTWTANLTNPLVAGTIITAKVTNPADVGTTQIGISEPVTVGTRTQLAIDTTTPLVEGETKITGTGTPGDVIQLFDSNGVQIAAKKITIATDGTWTANLTNPLVAGTIINAKVTNPADVGTTQIGISNSVTVAAIQKVQLIIDPPSDGDAKITGTGNSGDNLTVTITSGTNSTDYPVTVKPNGNWTLTLPTGITLLAGDKILVSGSSGPNPTANATVASKLTVSKIMEGDKSVSGTGAPDHTIQVTFPDGSKGTAVVDPDGKWSVKYTGTTPLTANQNVTATDTTDTNVIPVTKPVTALITIDKIYTGDIIITGTAQQGAHIIVTFPDGSKSLPIAVNQNDTWSVNVPAGITLKANDKVNAEVTDLDGTTNSVNGTVSDPSAATTMYLIYVGDDTITGTGNKGDIIELFYNGQSIGTTQVGNNGNWTFKIPANIYLSPNYKIKAVVQSRPSDFVELTISDAITADHVADKTKKVTSITDPYVYVGGDTTDDTSKKANKTDKTDKNTTSAEETTLNAVIYLDDYTINVGNTVNIMKGITAKDDGGNGNDITNKITVKGIVNTQVPGTYILTYSVTGANGTTVSRKLNITVENTGVKGYTVTNTTNTTKTTAVNTLGPRKCEPNVIGSP